MWNYVREYGPITALLVVAVVGYLLYDYHSETILSYSLNVIGDRLVEMVDDRDDQDVVAEAFDAFKARVFSHEVAPEQVAALAANVLNLEQRHARLTPEMATVMLEAATVMVDTVLAEGAGAGHVEVEVRMMQPRPPELIAPKALADLGTQIQAMLAFEKAVDEMAEAENLDSDLLAEHIYFGADDDLHVMLDETFQATLSPEAQAQMRAALERVEEARAVRWEAKLATRKKAEQERIVAEWEALRQLEAESAPDLQQKLAHMALVKQLQALGYRPPRPQDRRAFVLDTLRLLMPPPGVLPTEAGRPPNL